MSDFLRVEFYSLNHFSDLAQMLKEKGTVRTREYYLAKVKKENEQLYRELAELEYCEFKLNLEKQWREVRHSEEYEKLDKILFRIDSKNIAYSKFSLRNLGENYVEEKKRNIKTTEEKNSRVIKGGYDRYFYEEPSTLNHLYKEAGIYNDFYKESAVLSEKKQGYSSYTQKKDFLSIERKEFRKYAEIADSLSTLTLNLSPKEKLLIREYLMADTLSILSDVANEIPARKMIFIDIY